jgi:hypothetical protein
MKYIFYIIIPALIFYSCSYPIRKGFKEAEYKKISVLNNDFKKVVYRTTIDVYKNHFSGIMIIKKVEPDNSYRVVFLSELGMKIFDFEFNNKLPERFKIHQILEPINKKMLISTLRRDFQLFLKIYPQTAKTKTYTSKKFLLEKVKYKGLNNYYTLNKDSNFVNLITQKGLLFKKLTITTSGFSKSSPDNVIFEHKGINLTINLSKIR